MEQPFVLPLHSPFCLMPSPARKVSMGKTVIKFWSSSPDDAVIMKEGVQQNPVINIFWDAWSDERSESQRGVGYGQNSIRAFLVWFALHLDSPS